MASSRREGAGLFAYLKRAFVNHWNLLFFLGGAAAAAISPLPAVFQPQVGAAEVLYLAGLTGSPRFRKAVDAQAHASRRSGSAAVGRVGSETLETLVGGLSPVARERFDDLRARCLEMRAIASGVGGSTRRGKQTADELQGPALDRLLWVFLRLLYSQTSLGRFLRTTDDDQIARNVDDTREKLARAKEVGDERLTRSLTDSLATSELRLENYRRARQNAEFVDVELDRLERKIRTLAEMAVNRQDPDFISREVDSVAASMHQTEEAISELNLVDGLIDDLAEPPRILEADLREALES
jgi:hypothetical protein